MSLSLFLYLATEKIKAQQFSLMRFMNRGYCFLLLHEILLFALDVIPVCGLLGQLATVEVVDWGAGVCFFFGNFQLVHSRRGNWQNGYKLAPGGCLLIGF